MRGSDDNHDQILLKVEQFQGEEVMCRISSKEDGGCGIYSP